jgi:hypothetical protein
VRTRAAPAVSLFGSVPLQRKQDIANVSVLDSVAAEVKFVHRDDEFGIVASDGFLDAGRFTHFFSLETLMSPTIDNFGDFSIFVGYSRQNGNYLILSAGICWV